MADEEPTKASEPTEETGSAEPTATTASAKPARSTMTRLPLIMTVALALAAVSAASWLRPVVVRVAEDIQWRKRQVPAACVKRAEALAAVGRHDAALHYYRLALASAKTHDTKAQAGFAIGMYLLNRGLKRPGSPYILLGKQYLDGVLYYERDPERRVAIYRELMRAAVAMEDVKAMAHVAGEARRCTLDKEERAEFLRAEMDALLSFGGWSDMAKLLVASEPLGTNDRWQCEFTLRRAIAHEMVLDRADWLSEWQEEQNIADDDLAQAKERLFLQTRDLFDDLVETGVDRYVTESLFRLARLHFNHGDYGKADDYFGFFLAREPSSHLRETLLLMTKTARLRGRSESAEAMITAYLERFSWHEVAAGEFLAVVEHSLARGRVRQTLTLIENYLRLPVARKRLPELRAKAGELAKEINDLPRAEKHFKDLQAMSPGDALAGLALLERADLCLRQKDYDECRKWLTKYLTRYPYDERYGDGLFMLLEVFLKNGAGSSEVLAAAMAASNRSPEDPRTVTALMMVAKKLEASGLPGLAQRQYNKISLLHFLKSEEERVKEGQNDDAEILSQAVLGNARCLLELGDTARADRLLRELCNREEETPTRSEAAYWWASIKQKEGQRREALRRLDMVDITKVSPDIAARVAFDRMLLEVAVGRRSAEMSDELLSKLNDVPADEHGLFVRRAYLTCFDRLLKEGGLDNVRVFFDRAVTGPHSGSLPVDELSIRFAQMVLEKSGGMAFLACLKLNREAMVRGGIERAPVTEFLIGAGNSLEVSREEVGKYL